MLRNAEILHYAGGFSQYLSLISQEILKISSSSSQNTANLLEILEDMELNVAISEQEYNPDIATLHILAYLGAWDLVNLRFLLKRMPVFRFFAIFLTFFAKILEKHEKCKGTRDFCGDF